MDPLTLSIISVILALCVLVENTIGLLKIVQGIKSVQESAKAVQEGVKSIQEGVKTIQEGAKAIQEGIKSIQEGQIALQKSIAEDHRVMMEALERITIRLQEGKRST